MDCWLRLLSAAAEDDRDECIEWSLKLGYLTGQENEVRSFRFSPINEIDLDLDPAGNAQRTRKIDDSPRDSLQVWHASAFRVRATVKLVSHHG